MITAPPAHVDLWFDPVSGSAWLASRWMAEVAQRREIDLRFRVMSLSVLNEHKDLPPAYRELNDGSWGPARVMAAAAHQHGEEVTAPLYTAMGNLMHVGGDKDFSTVLPKALQEVGLPADLASVADTDEFDHMLRASHQAGVDLVGEDVGTPILCIDGAAIFGPALTAVPRGEKAAELFDSIRRLVQYPHFFELKRTGRGPFNFN